MYHHITNTIYKPETMASRYCWNVANIIWKNICKLFPRIHWAEIERIKNYLYPRYSSVFTIENNGFIRIEKKSWVSAMSNVGCDRRYSVASNIGYYRINVVQPKRNHFIWLPNFEAYPSKKWKKKRKCSNVMFRQDKHCTWELQY